ncbi:type III pantothenate kinase [Desulfosalsimonas propionicica]|uniref:Type III pantothenate kinase n=1 Tax=Desulfosalsimonas propionicica TaxID=332175 RepID=A0A7W0C6C1_9BACT|nr:type III pantothenate kinase [Desulfosalsimonas propionicica]MBA2879927.1 type III pantothenate kinase [Desulfosalsimonas propionicica]
MLLVLDVGNTHTVAGIFRDDKIAAQWRLHTDSKRTEDELHMHMDWFFAQNGLQLTDIDKTVISCVVPPMIQALDAYCRKYLQHPPHWIGPGVVNMPICYRNPREVGADRLVNAVAAYEKYRTSLVIIDFGTATTFDCVSEKGEYLGGAISPGIGISAEALFQRASKLPRVELFDPPASVIGKETAESMKSGLLYGYAELVDGMVKRIRKEMAPRPRVIATGGLATLLGKLSATIEAVEPDLTLEGLRLISKQL